MILVVGGAFQGKGRAARALAEKKIGREAFCREAECARFGGVEENEADILEHVHLLVRQEMDGQGMGTDAMASQGGEEKAAMESAVFRAVLIWLEECIQKKPDLVITMDELGCGVVPMTYYDRAYREIAGRLGCRLAEEAGEVYRVACGIPVRIK